MKNGENENGNIEKMGENGGRWGKRSGKRGG